MTLEQSKQYVLRILQARKIRRKRLEVCPSCPRTHIYVSDVDVCDWSDYQSMPMPPGWRHVHIPGA
jgi:hypothetical protein